MEINKIYNENCLDTMAKMPDNFIDLTVTSPPYDNLRNYNGYSFDFESIAKELYRVTKEGGVVVWVVGDATINGSETGTSFRQALYFKEIGFNTSMPGKERTDEDLRNRVISAYGHFPQVGEYWSADPDFWRSRYVGNPHIGKFGKDDVNKKLEEYKNAS